MKLLRHRGFLTGLALLASSFLTTFGEEMWRIHEWGTFTSLQNEEGQAVGGINTDDEPVPKFVHRLSSLLLLQPTDLPRLFFQGAPACHPDVTMRLETPVIYFHPPQSSPEEERINVRVKFRGGWLTEFYPEASADAPGLKEGTFNFPHLDSQTVSKLEWNDLKVGGGWPVPQTTDHVWTSPRNVAAALVQTPQGEAEKFLFYRGVGHIKAPLTVSRDTNSGEFLFRSDLAELPHGTRLTIPALWLVDIRSDARVAFRSLSPLVLTGKSKILAHTAQRFESKDFSAANLHKLKGSLQTALVAEGLFEDEALALLNTWELSYFKSAGLRVFFIVPQTWTDFYLPLEASRPAEIKRVMVGRIELVTPAQRAALGRIGHFSTNQISQEVNGLRTDVYARLQNGGEKDWAALAAGTKRLASAISVPESYQIYLDLGRFRNALILEEAKLRPTQGLTNFISLYGLSAYEPH